MALFNLRFRDNLQSKLPDISRAAIIAEFENLTTQLSDWALKEHKEDGTHNTLPSGYSFVPVGGMIRWNTTIYPTNWLICDGRAVSRTEYPLLFKAIGISAGPGDGVNTFNLPTVANFIILAA